MIIDAARFLPQSRVRLFVVGHMQNGKGMWKVQEAPGFYESDIRPKPLARSFIFNHPTRLSGTSERFLRTARNVAGIVGHPWKICPKTSSFWWNDARRNYLINQMSEKHAVQLKKMMAGNKWSYGTVFRRIRKGRSMAELRNDSVQDA